MRTVSPAALTRLLGAAWRTGRGPHPGPGHGAAYAALADAIRLLVLDGRLPLETRLPSERDLAAALGVSRTTVSAAYATLREAGYLRSRQGSGSWTGLPADRRSDPTGLWAPAPPTGDLLDLAHAAPPAPAGALHHAVEEAVAELPRHLPGHGYDPLGLPVLRAAIAARYTVRGLPTDPDQVLVTSGAQHGWSLVLRLLVGTGDRVAIESPTYPNTLDAARAAGARLVPVPVTPGGWDLDGFAAALRQTAPRLSHLTPDFQNPTGALLSDEGRARISTAARETRTTVVVDETLCDLPLDGQVMPPPMPAYDSAVIAVGSASKSFWGGLRVGWVRADHSVVRRLAAVRATLDLGSPVLEQLVVTALLRGADQLLAERRADLAARRDALLERLRATLPDWECPTPGGGLVLWCRLPVPVSSALAVAAEHHGLRLAAGPRFGVEGTFEQHLRVPYTLSPADLLRAADRLAAAYRAVTDGRPASTLEEPRLTTVA